MIIYHFNAPAREKYLKKQKSLVVILVFPKLVIFNFHSNIKFSLFLIL